MRSRKTKAPITKRVHYIDLPSSKRVGCGKLSETVIFSIDTSNVTCESCLASLGLIPDNRKGPIGKRSNFKVATFTDFGEPGRVEEIGKHYTISSAMRQYARIWDIYGRRGEARVWQKMVSQAK